MLGSDTVRALMSVLGRSAGRASLRGPVGWAVGYGRLARNDI